MAGLPTGFDSCLMEIDRLTDGVSGWLTDREREFLALAAACPVAEGVILEIGSFRGRSTIVLSKASSLTDATDIVAVDPLTYCGPGEPDDDGEAARSIFNANLERAGVREQVEFHQTYSQDLGKDWDRPIRLLWIDGDHSYEGAKRDFDTFAPYLADGAIIAFHDILNFCEAVRVFHEDVVDSPGFGPVGIVGSIGWGRYSADPATCRPYRTEKASLSRRLAPLSRIRFEDRSRVTRVRYKVRRWLVPHGPINRSAWLKKVA